MKASAKPYPFYEQDGQNQLKLIPYLWPKQLKNHTLWGPTYLYGPYKGVPLPPRFSSWVGRFCISRVLQASAVKCRSIPSIITLSWPLIDPQSRPLADTWSTLHQHFNRQSVNSWLIFTNMPSVVNQYTIDLVEYWPTVDGVSIKCRPRGSLMLAEYQASVHWDGYRMLFESINQRLTANAFTTHGLIYLLHLQFVPVNFFRKNFWENWAVLGNSNICIPQCKYHYRTLLVVYLSSRQVVRMR